MGWAVFLFLLVTIIGCAPPPVADGTRRVVSLDYCADQYVLALIPRGEIAALSLDAEAEYSYLRAAAKGIPQTSSRTEDVLAHRPTVAVRTYGGGPLALSKFERLGVSVVQIGFAASFDEIEKTVEQAGEALDAQDRAADLIKAMLEEIARIPPPGEERPTTLYVAQGGVTAGSGTLIDDIIQTSGWANGETRPGWHPLPLETIAAAPPEHFTLGFFGGEHRVNSPWNAARHPVLRRAMAMTPTTGLDTAWTSCAGWFVAHAATVLADARKMEPQK